jgi:hypothetical protein
VLAVLMFAGAILMYFAAQQTTFSTFFPLLLAYSLTYMPTIALTNSIAFANVDDVEADFPRIRVMGTIGWIASGLVRFLPQMLGYSDISPTNIPLLMPPAAPRCSASLPCSCRIRRRKAGKTGLQSDAGAGCADPAARQKLPRVLLLLVPVRHAAGLLLHLRQRLSHRSGA